MDQYEYTLIRYDTRGLMVDTVVCAGKHEIQDLLNDGWRVVMDKPEMVIRKSWKIQQNWPR